jgi:LysR family glycine cleavage system transcriptional activator
MLEMNRAPYLNGARAFEAAARLGGFAAAAKELNVTPSAISRMTRLLEERMGVTLFNRSANRLTLTAAGQTFRAGLFPIFDALARLTDQVSKLGQGNVLTVGVGPTFATRWLIPRLSEFAAMAPDVEVRFATGGVAGTFSDDWTCGIKLGSGAWPGLVAEPLFAADLVPVCAPALADRMRAPRQLARATLLRVAHAPDDWPSWLGAMDLSDLKATGPIFGFYGQAIQAATDGLGVAMGIRPYIDDDLAAGRLVAPFARSVPKGSQWYLIYKDFRSEDRTFAAFRDWLLRQAGRDDARA